MVVPGSDRPQADGDSNGPAPRPPGYRSPDPDRVQRAAAALRDCALEPIVDLVVTPDE